MPCALQAFQLHAHLPGLSRDVFGVLLSTALASLRDGGLYPCGSCAPDQLCSGFDSKEAAAMRTFAGAMAASVNAAASKSFEDAKDGTVSFFSNSPILAGFFAFAFAQSLKVFTTWYKEKRLDWKRLLGPGGMPSSHSATVMALVVSIGLRDGPGSSLFAIAVVLAAVVMYDASGVRLQAGRQAEVLNQIVYELPPEHPLSDSRPLRDMLGHTPPQVAAGALLGCIVAYMLSLAERAHP